MSEVQPAPTTEPTEGRESGLSLYEQPATPPVVDVTPEPEGETPPVEEANAGEESSEEIAPAPDGAEGQEPPAGGAEDEEQTVSSLSELIEAKEWDPEWFDTLKIPVKVDGVPADATMKDLVANYQMNAAADKRLEEAKVKAKEANEELGRQTEQLNSQLAVAATLLKNAEDAFVADEATVDWEGLRADDPAEYSAKKTEFAEKRARFEDAKRKAATDIQAAAEQRLKEAQEAQQQFVQEESAKLLEAIPDWRDSDKAKAEKAQVAEYLIGQGFSQDDVMGASDHRHIVVARKAMLFDAMQSDKNASRKKVVKTPKVMKPGVKADTSQKPEPEDRASILYG